MNNSKILKVSNLTTLCTCMLIGSSLLMTACGGNSGKSSNVTPIDTISNDAMQKFIKNSKWTLVEDVAGGNPELQGVKNNITVSFNNVDNKNSLSFNVGCNVHNAGYTLSSDNYLNAEPAISTEQYCAELDTAEKFLEIFFRGNVKLSTKASGIETLVMRSDDGRTLNWVRDSSVDSSVEEKNKALLETLKRYNWKLVESSDANTNLNLSNSLNSSALHFESTKENTVSYSMGCNKFTGKFTLDNKEILTATNMIPTEKMCSESLMNAEKSLNQLMSTGSKFLHIIPTTYNPAQGITKDTPVLSQMVNTSKKTFLKWVGTKKNFTAKVDAKITKRTAQGVTVLKEETKTFNNVTIPAGTNEPTSPKPKFCDDTNIYKYGFLHQQLSNMFNTTCDYDGIADVVYTATNTDNNEVYSYKIKLTETPLTN